jgi:hypothetical protein
VLDAQLGDLIDTILQFKSILHDIDKGEGEARATSSLLLYFANKVNPANISQVISFGYLTRRNILSLFIFKFVFLGLLQGLLLLICCDHSLLLDYTLSLLVARLGWSRQETLIH